ncbi:MAG: PilZ domain-containing protein [Candidatus Omnitrophica bacterium]|nr:PilZ domain-containing protein [Candidatus Omnitrophota bacterium]
MEEKRRYVRSNGLVLVDYKGIKIEGKCSAFDVSGIGVRLIVDRKLDVGTNVEVELFLPGDSQAVPAKGKIVWIKKCKETEETNVEKKKEYYYAGVELTEIDERSRVRISKYVYRRLH